MIKYEIKNGLYIIKSGTLINNKIVMWTTFYYYNGIVIDTGCANTAKEAYKFVSNLGDIKAILLTHSHEDHVGGAYLYDEDGFQIHAPEKSIETLRNPPSIPEYRKLVWGQPKPVDAKPLKRNMRFGDIDIKTFDAPGHSDDHVVILINDMLFIGDLIGSKRPMIAFYTENYNRIIKTIEEIMLNLKFTNVYGGHIIISKGEMKDILHYLKKLRERIRELYSESSDIDKIVDAILDKVPEKVLLMEVASSGEWSRKHLIKTLL